MTGTNYVKFLGAFLAMTSAVAATESALAEAVQSIRGTVKVAPELEKKVTPTSVLYVIARAEGVQGGPPLAVVRVASPKFPQSFEMGAENMMMPESEFKGPFELTAKLSKSGNAMTSPGDLLGGSKEKKAYSAGAKNVQLVLNKEAP